MAELSGVEVLQSEIEKSKDKLKYYNENFKKLTGRDPGRPGPRRMLSGDGHDRDEEGYSGRMARGRGRLFGLARRGIMEESGPPAKRRAVGGAFSRLGPVPASARRKEREDSPYEEELPHKLSVHSSVVSTSREAKNRQEIMQEQTKDKEGMQRNRRMFGLLLGTLNRFKTESKTLETKDVQRKKIEEKLEVNAEKEKRKFKQETKLLIEELHLEQSKITRLEQKMEMVQEHAEREVEMEKLKNFIATKSKPRIFWKPVQMSTLMENKLKDSKKVVDEMLQEGKDRLEKEIKELMEREIKREERIKMRLREDGLFGDEEEIEGQEGGAGVKEGGGGVVAEEVKQELDQSRLSKEAEEAHSEEEEEEDDSKEIKKKSRRTVVVEKDGGSSSASSGEEDSGGKEVTQVADAKRKILVKVEENGNESSSSSDEEEGGKKVEKEGHSLSKEVEREVVVRGVVPEPEAHVALSKSKGDSDDEEKDKEKDKQEERELRREKRREASEDTDKRRHRREEGRKRRDSKERERSDRERFKRDRREDRRGKERSYEVDKRRRSREKRQDSSSESEVEIKKEKKDDREGKVKKIKDRHSDRKSGEDRVREESELKSKHSAKGEVESGEDTD
ncbi:pinin-like [Physella acuta]|uniref:pinin-like n=1 Tax=Physella acuta TaxID=109671 RepID=UPI0027DC1F7A|nr:pinin-like [Physella acuta]